jgi:hypothetical protein
MDMKYKKKKSTTTKQQQQNSWWVAGVCGEFGRTQSSAGRALGELEWVLKRFGMPS